MSEVKTSYFPIGGGLDIVTPALSIAPGRALALVNYEPWFNGGYRRIDGFERVDGRPRPSEQTFTGFKVNAVEDLVLGNTVTGGTSGATGVVIGKYEDDGTFGSDVVGLTKVTGTFVIGESLGVPQTNVDHQLVPNAAVTDAGLVIASGLFTDMDEGLEEAESATGLYRDDDVPALRSIDDSWSGNTVTIPMSSLDGGATSVNSWTLRVRARVLREGPETDDLVTYRFTFGPGADSQFVSFTQADANDGWITRTITQAVSAASVANVNAEDVVLSQAVYTLNGFDADGLSIEVDVVDVVVDYSGTTNVRSAPIVRYAPTIDIEDQFLYNAREEYRADIGVVPGTGPVRGAWQRFDDRFAWRNNVGNTAGIMHLASAAGWTTTGTTLVDTLFYDTGDDSLVATFIQEGDTINGLTSGATALVHRVLIHAGAPGTADATGYLALLSVTGAFVVGEDIRIGALKVAETVTVNSDYVFPPGGKYKFINQNFYATTGQYNVYGVNGVGPAFEIDENNVVTPILFPDVTPPGDIEPDANTPFFVEEHRNHLFLAMPGGRFTQSVQGEPLSINGFLGAAEFGMGAEITGMQSVVGSVLIVTTEDEIRGLFGANIIDWELRLIGEKSGAKLYSAQKLDTVYGVDNLGITSVKSTDAFGSFGGSTVSQLVQPMLDALRGKLNDSTIVRKANQYRTYFEGNECLIMYVPAPGSEAVRSGIISSVGTAFGFASYPFAIKSIWNTEDQFGDERTYFVTESTNNAFGTLTPNEGYVFEDLVGASFDGDFIRSTGRIAFNSIKTPAYKKHYYRADLEMSAAGPVHIKVAQDLTFGATEVSSSITDLTSSDIQVLDIFAGGGFWDIANWDNFLWDATNLGLLRVPLTGSGENIGFLFYNESNITPPFILQSMIIHYSVRRLQR